MPRRVTRSILDHHRAIAEQIVGAVHLDDLVTMIIVRRDERIGLDQFRDVASLPFALLDDQPGVRNGFIAAGMMGIFYAIYKWMNFPLTVGKITSYSISLYWGFRCVGQK